ncbi:MAG: hypothetical protein Q8O67_01460 [Deltaproteobacteria bacterium]|nr:hypothetical protein [Deltaproteobacteria bacterium]
MRLASMAQLTSTQAVSVTDTPELKARLEKAIAKLRTDFDGSGPVPKRTGDPQRRSLKVGSEDPRTLRRHINGFVDLMSQRSLFLGNVSVSIRRVNEAAGATLECARVSVWFHDEKGSKITCADLFEKNNGAHSSGVELFAKDFPSYFKAVASEVTIAAPRRAHRPAHLVFFRGVPEAAGHQLDARRPDLGRGQDGRRHLPRAHRPAAPVEQRRGELRLPDGELRGPGDGAPRDLAGYRTIENGGSIT